MIINLKFNKFLFASFFIFTISNCSFTGMFRDSFDAAAQRARNEIKKTPQAQDLMTRSALLGCFAGMLTGFAGGVTLRPLVVVLSLGANLAFNAGATSLTKEAVSWRDDPSYQGTFIVLQNELPHDSLKRVYVGEQQMAGNLVGLAVGVLAGLSVHALVSALFSKKDAKNQRE